MTLNQPAGDQRARRARVIRNALVLAVTALAIYTVFILLMAERSQGLS